MTAAPCRRRSAPVAGVVALLLAGAPPVAAQAPRWQPHFGVHAGTPQAVSLAVGVLRIVQRSGDFTQVRGPRLVVEPGVRAGKLRVGWVVTGAFATGYAIEAAALRVWDDAQTLPGVEVHGTYFFIDGGLGFFAGRKERRLSLSVGVSL